jgi:hypothetical protein
MPSIRREQLCRTRCCGATVDRSFPGNDQKIAACGKLLQVNKNAAHLTMGGVVHCAEMFGPQSLSLLNRTQDIKK